MRPECSDTSGLVPKTSLGPKSGLQTTPLLIIYPSHAAQSGSVAAAAISPLRTDSVLI